MSWETIIADPEFQALESDRKQKIANNYFAKNFESDKDFISLPEAKRFKIRSNFESTLNLEKQLPIPQPTPTPKTTGLQLEDTIGAPHGATGKWEEPSIVDKTKNIATDIGLKVLDHLKTTGLKLGDLYQKGEEEARNLETYLNQPAESPTGIKDFLTRTLPESALKTAKGIAELPRTIGESIAEPIAKNIIDVYSGEKTVPQAWKDMGKEEASKVYEGIKGFGEFLGKPIGTYGLQELKKSWVEHPVESGLALSSFVAPIASRTGRTEISNSVNVVLSKAKRAGWYDKVPFIGERLTSKVYDELLAKGMTEAEIIRTTDGSGKAKPSFLREAIRRRATPDTNIPTEPSAAPIPQPATGLKIEQPAKREVPKFEPEPEIRTTGQGLKLEEPTVAPIIKPPIKTYEENIIVKGEKPIISTITKEVIASEAQGQKAQEGQKRRDEGNVQEILPLKPEQGTSPDIQELPTGEAAPGISMTREEVLRPVTELSLEMERIRNKIDDINRKPYTKNTALNIKRMNEIDALEQQYKETENKRTIASQPFIKGEYRPDLQLTKEGETDAKKIREDAGLVPEGRDVEEGIAEKGRKDLELKAQGEGISGKGKEIKQDSKIVWQANKQGGQSIGNKQFIRKPTFEDFQKEILPITRQGYYGNGTIEQQYQEMLTKEPTVTISFIDTGKGWIVNKIDDFDNIKTEIQNGIKKGWAKVVNDFESSEAKTIRQSFDSERLLKQPSGEAPTAPAQIQQTEVIEKPSPELQTKSNVSQIPSENLKVGQTFLPDLGETPLREYGPIESVTTKPEVITPERLEAAISTGIPENTDRVFSWSEVENYILAKMSIQKIGKSAISKVGDTNYGKQIITALKNKTAIIKYEMSRKYSKEEATNKYNYEYLFNPYSFISTREVVGKKTPKLPDSFTNSVIKEMEKQGIVKDVTPRQPFYGERRFLINFNKEFKIPEGEVSAAPAQIQPTEVIEKPSTIYTAINKSGVKVAEYTTSDFNNPDTVEHVFINELRKNLNIGDEGIQSLILTKDYLENSGNITNISKENIPPIEKLNKITTLAGSFSEYIKSIENKKLKYSQPKLLEGEKVDIKPKMESEIQGQQKLFGKKAGVADIGGYSELAQGKAEEGKAPPPKETPPGIPRPEELEKFDLPELVEIAKGLLNEYPELKNNLGKALGAFYPGQGLIKLRRDLAKDPKLAELVLAHEIGHGGVDWLPDKTLKRGNILGHIGSFRNYLKTLLKEYPKSPNEILTNEDRTRFRRQAVELAKQELKSKQVGGLEVLPQQVLDIWNDIQGKEKNPILYDYIVKLSEQEKKQILLDALKGKVEFKLFDPGQEGFKSLDEKTKELYRKLVKEEIIKRKLYEEEVIRDELKKLTQAWKPFNEKTNISFTKYRYSSVELYADAVSVLLNNPKLLADTAPNFYKAFFSYIEKKAEFRDLYYSITSQYKKGTIAEHRAELSALMTESGEKAFALPVQEKAERTFAERVGRVIGGLKKELVDKFSPLYDSIKSKEIRKHVRNSVEDFIYKESEKQFYMNEIYEKGGLKDVQDNKIPETDLADYVKTRRIIYERGEIFNPGGHNPITAQTLLDNLKVKLGVEKYKVLEDSIEKFWEVRKTHILARMRESRMHDEELMKKLEENKYYVTFDHTEAIEARFGKRITAKIYKQVGSLKEIANPYTATILKDMAILDSINFNTAKRESLEGLRKDNYPDILIPETTKQRTPTGWATVLKESVDPRFELVTWIENGKVNGYYIPKNVADAFDKSPIDTWKVVRILNKISQPYREIFTRKRPGFALFNIIRDPQAAMMILPGANIHNFPYLMAKAIVPAIKGQHGFEAKTQRLLRSKALLTTVDTTGMTPEDTQLERLMVYYGLKYPAKNNMIYRSIERLGAWLNYLGDTSERITKIAVADYVDKHYPDMSESDKMHLVRWAGSPAFLVGGEAKQLTNNLLLFFNPQVQGWRIQGEVAKERPIEFALKTVQFAIIPKILMALGLAGYFGDEIKDIYLRISSYGLTNYSVYPIGLTPSGKAVSIYIPQSETNRFIGGIFWKLWTGIKKPSDVLGLFDYTVGQFPGLNPGIGLMTSLMQLLTGQKVYDSFRQKYAIPEEIREAKDWRSVESYFKYFWNQQGLGIVHKFDTDNIDDIKKGIDKLIRYPISSDILGRFIRVEDSGLTSKLYEAAEPIRTSEARYRLDLKEAIGNIINQKPKDKWNENQKTAWGYFALTSTDKEIQNRISRYLNKAQGTALERALSSATSNAQKEAIAERFLELTKTSKSW